MRQRIVVIGSSFAGLSAALELKHHLGAHHDVLVVTQHEDFVFQPSLIWVPFGLRGPEDISFPVTPVLKERGVEVHHGEVVRILPGQRRVQTADMTYDYDYLVLATGARHAWEAVEGLGPRRGHTASIFELDEAMAAQRSYAALLDRTSPPAWRPAGDRPGPVVVGAAPGAAYFGAACEFLLNLAHQLGKHGLADAVPLTYVTPEPFVGHLGVGGFGRSQQAVEHLFARARITAVTDARIAGVTPGEIHLDDGQRLPFQLAMIAPGLEGAPVVRTLGQGVTPAGFLRVDPMYRTEAWPSVYACGPGVDIAPPGETRVPCHVPCPGYLSEEMGRVVAYNIAAAIEKRRPVALPPASIDAKWVLDAGNTGAIMSSDHFLEPREHAWVIPGPEAHWAKLVFEKYFLATRRRGVV